MVWDPSSSLDHEWDDDLSDMPTLVPVPTLGTDEDSDSTYDPFLLDNVREADFLVQESLERSKLVRSKQPFNSTCLPTMTMDVSFEAPSDGKYKPTSSPAQMITLSNLSFIAESPNKNESDLVEIRHKLHFEADSKMSVMTILKLFLEQLMLLDSHAYLLSKDTSRHFQYVQDLPTAQLDLQKLFPAMILHRHSGNCIVLRLTRQRWFRPPKLDFWTRIAATTISCSTSAQSP